MVGVVVVSHCDLAGELLRATRIIVGEDKAVEAMEALSVQMNEMNEELRKRIAWAIRKVDRGEGVLILTDMFGGTPSNLSLSFLEEGKVEVVTGVNLPMMIALGNYREGKTLRELAEFVASYGRKHINLAHEILQKRSS
ncbi:MAG: PTS sugar transporter subunit IIA [Thermodesulfobacteriota bacterium]